MADYGSSGIWVIETIGPFRHGMVWYESLGIPADLSDRFKAWIAAYWQRLEEDKFKVREFNALGRRLAMELKGFFGPDTYVEFIPETPNGGLGEPEVI